MMKDIGVVMQTPLAIVFEGIPRSELVEKDIRDRVENLEENFDRIISCRVHLELKNNSHHQGRIYFHLNSVVDNMFHSLEPGSEVRFMECEGDQGPQASSVHVLGKYHVVG